MLKTLWTEEIIFFAMTMTNYNTAITSTSSDRNEQLPRLVLINTSLPIPQNAQYEIHSAETRWRARSA